MNTSPKVYKAIISDTVLSDLKTGGNYYTVYFDLFDENKKVATISKFVTYHLPNHTISSFYVNFLSHFYPSTSNIKIPMKSLVSKQCFVEVTNFGWPRINKISIN